MNEEEPASEIVEESKEEIQIVEYMIKWESEDFKDYNVDEETLSDPDSEIEGYMCTEKEIQARTILWEEINKDYL